MDEYVAIILIIIIIIISIGISAFVSLTEL